MDTHTPGMTPPALLEALARACEVLPERFARFEYWPEAWWAVFTKDNDEPGFVSIQDADKPRNLMRLEYACREEIRSRGLPWQVESVHGGWCDGGFKARIAGEWQYASTPAHALLLALLAALEAQP